MRATRVLWLLLAAWFAGSGARGQNAVSNGSFDTDVVGWTAQTDVTVVWSVVDASNSPASGAAEVTNNSPGAGMGRGMTQCLGIGIEEGAAYDFGGKAFIPAAQD